MSVDTNPNGTLTNIAKALISTTAASHDKASAMPGDFYTSPDLLELEREHLFGREWVAVGRVEEIADPGDFLTAQIYNEPIIVVRGEDGEIRALSNVCRHRAMLVAEGNGNARRLVCPYHAWTYDLKGQLIGAPHIAKRDDFEKSSCRLPEFKSEIWQGFIFVSLASDTKPLAPRLSGLDAIIENYHFEQMQTRYINHEIWDTNWKCLVENFMEGYHLSPLHRETLHPVNPTSLCQHFPAGEGYFGFFAGFSPDMQRFGVGHPDLNDKEANTCVMFAVPPGLVVGGGSDYSSFLCIQPRTPNSVGVKLGLFFHGDHWTSDAVDHAVELFERTMAEDKVILNEIARGLGSKHYFPGPLAPAAYEGCIVDFHKYLADRLSPALRN